MYPQQNSKPLLVSELVNTYKGISTSTITAEKDSTAAPQPEHLAVSSTAKINEIIEANSDKLK